MCFSCDSLNPFGSDTVGGDNGGNTEIRDGGDAGQPRRERNRRSVLKPSPSPQLTTVKEFTRRGIVGYFCY